jgi:hypothetical protein
MNDSDLQILKFSQQGFCCSQIILLMALELQEKENPSLVRTMSALCHGMPSGKGVCGAYTGAACLIGYYAGKGTLYEEEIQSYQTMLDTLAQWFEQFCLSSGHGVHCEEIVDGSNVNPSVCGALISKCYGEAISILLSNNIDLQSEKNE